jgi:hypothetical protein
MLIVTDSAASVGQRPQDHAIPAVNQQYGSHSSYYAFSNGNTRRFDQNSQVPRTQANPFLTPNFFNTPSNTQANESLPAYQSTVYGTQTPYHESPQQTHRAFDPHAPLTLEQQQHLQAQVAAATNRGLASFGTYSQQRYSQVNPAYSNQTLGNQFGDPLSVPPTILAPPVLPQLFRPDQIISRAPLLPSYQQNTDLLDTLVTRTKDMSSMEQDPKGLTSFHLFPQLPYVICSVMVPLNS